MKLEKIKKDNRKKIIIGSMIVLSVVGCLTLTATRAKYRSIQNIKLANGVVDYKAPDLKIAIKVSEDGTTYKNSSTIPEGNYILNTEKSKCRIPTLDLVGEEAMVAEGVSIEYVEGKINVLGVTKKDTRCYIYFDKVLGQTSSTIIASIKARTDGSYKENTTPTFNTIATGVETEENSGIYETDDPMYGENAKTYYWRGAATTNHVIFDNKCWRIVRINGDGSIRVIYNGTPTNNTCSGNGTNANSVVLKNTAYNSSRDKSYYVGWTYTSSNTQPRPSNANPQKSGEPASLKTALESWYGNDANISEAARKNIVSGKFCNDRNIGYGSYSADGISFQYASKIRNYDSSNPSLSCPDGDVYELNVGMITADEVTFAGASRHISNTSYYLCNGQYYWTMSPYGWDNSTSQIASVLFVRDKGSLTDYYVSSTSPSVRPVINLGVDTLFNEGSDGTQNNPYIVQ